LIKALRKIDSQAEDHLLAYRIMTASMIIPAVHLPRVGRSLVVLEQSILKSFDEIRGQYIYIYIYYILIIQTFKVERSVHLRILVAYPLNNLHALPVNASVISSYFLKYFLFKNIL